MIELGSTVKDTISGFVGIATARHIYLHTTTCYGVQAKVDKDGNLPAVKYFDESQLIVTKKPAPKPRTPQRVLG